MCFGFSGSLTIESIFAAAMNSFESVFLQCAREMEIVPSSASDYKINTLFLSLFGVSPLVAGIIWEHLITNGNLENGCKPDHLLWTLFFLKCYAYENVLSQMFKADRKTIRKWIWILVAKIADLSNEVVRYKHDIIVFIQLIISNLFLRFFGVTDSMVTLLTYAK
jgi:hypothetical protein